MPTRNSSIMLKVLRAQLKAGTDALQRGDFIEVDDADLESHLERLTRRPRNRRGSRIARTRGGPGAAAPQSRHNKRKTGLKG